MYGNESIQNNICLHTNNAHYVFCSTGGIQAACHIPVIIRGSWFSWENGQNTLTEINADSMTKKGYCVAIKNDFHANYTLVFHDRQNECYNCVKFMVRTVNVIEKIESKLLS